MASSFLLTSRELEFLGEELLQLDVEPQLIGHGHGLQRAEVGMTQAHGASKPSAPAAAGPAGNPPAIAPCHKPIQALQRGCPIPKPPRRAASHGDLPAHTPHTALAAVHQLPASCVTAMQEVEQMEQQLGAAMAAGTAACGKLQAQLAWTYNTAAMQLFEAGQDSEALRLLEKAQVLCDMGGLDASVQPRLLATTLNNMACAHKRRGAVRTALQLLQHAAQVEQAGGTAASSGRAAGQQGSGHAGHACTATGLPGDGMPPHSQRSIAALQQEPQQPQQEQQQQAQEAHLHAQQEAVQTAESMASTQLNLSTVLSALRRHDEALHAAQAALQQLCIAWGLQAAQVLAWGAAAAGATAFSARSSSSGGTAPQPHSRRAGGASSQAAGGDVAGESTDRHVWRRHSTTGSSRNSTSGKTDAVGLSAATEVAAGPAHPGHPLGSCQEAACKPAQACIRSGSTSCSGTSDGSGTSGVPASSTCGSISSCTGSEVQLGSSTHCLQGGQQQLEQPPLQPSGQPAGLQGVGQHLGRLSQASARILAMCVYNQAVQHEHLGDSGAALQLYAAAAKLAVRLCGRTSPWATQFNKTLQAFKCQQQHRSRQHGQAWPSAAAANTSGRPPRSNSTPNSARRCGSSNGSALDASSCHGSRPGPACAAPADATRVCRSVGAPRSPADAQLQQRPPPQPPHLQHPLQQQQLQQKTTFIGAAPVASKQRGPLGACCMAEQRGDLVGSQPKRLPPRSLSARGHKPVPVPCYQVTAASGVLQPAALSMHASLEGPAAKTGSMPFRKPQLQRHSSYDAAAAYAAATARVGASAAGTARSLSGSASVVVVAGASPTQPRDGGSHGQLSGCPSHGAPPAHAGAAPAVAQATAPAVALAVAVGPAGTQALLQPAVGTCRSAGAAAATGGGGGAAAAAVRSPAPTARLDTLISAHLQSLRQLHSQLAAAQL